MTQSAADQESTAHLKVRSLADVTDVVSCGLQLGKLCLTESNLGAEFFDLRTGIAGEMLQKFVNYRILLAIVVASPEEHGERFSELAREHQSHPSVRFFPNESQARAWLASV